MSIKNKTNLELHPGDLIVWWQSYNGGGYKLNNIVEVISGFRVDPTKKLSHWIFVPIGQLGFLIAIGEKTYTYMLLSPKHAGAVYTSCHPESDHHAKPTRVNSSF